MGNWISSYLWNTEEEEGEEENDDAIPQPPQINPRIRLARKLQEMITSLPINYSNNLHSLSEHTELQSLLQDCSSHNHDLCTWQNFEGWNVLHLIAMKKNKDFVDECLKHHPMLLETKNRNNGYSLLLIAISSGIQSYVDSVLEKTRDEEHMLSLCAVNPLSACAANGHFKMLQFFLEKYPKLDVNAKSGKDREFPLYLACKSGSVPIVQFLIEKGADMSLGTSQNSTVLHASVARGDIELVSWILDEAAKRKIDLIDVQKRDGNTALHLVCDEEFIKRYPQQLFPVVRILLKHKTKAVTMINTFAQTPLILATLSANLELIKLLIEAGSDLNQGDCDGLTVMHVICRARKLNSQNLKDHLDVLHFLFKQGININAPDFGNCTPLFCAVYSGSYDICKVLLENGADPTIENLQGWSPLHAAYSFYDKRTDLADLLEKHASKEYLDTFDLSKPKDLNSLRRPFTRLSISERQSIMPSFDLSGLVQLLQQTNKKVVVLCGAGISVSAGIPAFRTPTGLYKSETIKQFDTDNELSNPQDAFSAYCIKEKPEIFYRIVSSIFLPVVQKKYKPTSFHWFMKILDDKGLLKRVYTQNIDALERLTGLSPEKLIESHGTFSTNHCIECAAPGDPALFWKQIEAQSIPKCQKCKGTLRPDVVFFGEGLPNEFMDKRTQDLKSADILIVAGTSLMVYPFAGLVNEVNEICPRFLFNMDPTGPFKRRSELLTMLKKSPANLNNNNNNNNYDPLLDWNWRDVFVEGEIDKNIEQVMQQLGWNDLLNQYKTNYEK